MKVFPLPNALDRAVTRGAYNYQVQESLQVDKLNQVVRVDYALNPRDSFYVRANFWNADNLGFAVPAGSSNWGLIKQFYIFKDNGVVGSWTHLFNAQIVNEFKAGFRRNGEDGPPASDEDLSRIQRDKIGFTLRQFTPEINPANVVPQATFGGGAERSRHHLQRAFPGEWFR